MSRVGSKLIPGYDSYLAFSRETGLDPVTIRHQMNRGYCRWPRKQALASVAKYEAHPLYARWGKIASRKDTAPEWRVSFPAFLADVGDEPRGRITRIDCSKGFGPDNVYWYESGAAIIEAQEIEL